MSSSINYSCSSDKNNRSIDLVFESLDRKLNIGEDVFYNIVKKNDMIVGGTAVLIDHMTESAEEGFMYGLEDSVLTIVSRVSKCDYILEPLRNMTSENNSTIIRRRTDNSYRSFFKELGINEYFLFDFSTDPSVLVDSIEIYTVFENSSPTAALVVYGYDVLTSYITFRETDDIEQRKFVSSYKNSITKDNAVAHLLSEASQEYYDENVYPKQTVLQLNFINESSVYYLQNAGFDIIYGEHNINLDKVTINKLFGISEDGDKIFNTDYIQEYVLSGIADSIIYDSRLGFFTHGYPILGISTDRDPNLKAFNSYSFSPYLNSVYEYRNQTINGIYKLYEKAIAYDYVEDINSDHLYIYNQNFNVSRNRYKIVEETSEASSAGKVDIERYIRLRYYFDREYYRSLPTDEERESYKKLCFINHISALVTYLINKRKNTPETDKSEQRIFDILYRISRMLIETYSESYLECCKKEAEVKEEIHMGTGVEPYFDDYLDDDSYLNIREFIEKDRRNHIILFLEDGVILPMHRQHLLDKLVKRTEEFVFFKCSSKFDNADPLVISYSDVDFTEPYFQMTGSTQELNFRVAEMYSIVFGDKFNYYKLTKDKTVNRIAVANSMQFHQGNILGEDLNVVSGYHCQSGVTKNIYRVAIVDVTNFVEVERVTTNRKVITLEDVFRKYPETREIYDSTESKGMKIRMAARLQIDGEHKNRLIQSIQSQRVVNIPLPLLGSDDPEREIGGRRRYGLDSESDTDTDGEVQPTRLDFGDEQTQVLEPQSIERNP